jgi:predicted protein tyrosine phosphatase
MKGVSKSAVRKLTRGDVEWAEVIVVMEREHKQRLMASFGETVRSREVTVHVLDIPDNYQYMQPELVELLRSKIDALIFE